VPLTPQTTASLRDYLAVHPRRGEPSAALPTGTHPHALRHTYANPVRGSGIAMFEVSRFMGHAKPSTTEAVYAHLPREDHSGAMAALGGMAEPAAGTGNVIPMRR
jgi:integrase